MTVLPPRARRAVLVLLAGVLPLAPAACGGSGGNGGDGEPVRLTVPRGATLGAVTDTLVARGLVASELLFRAYAKVRGDATRIRAGGYAFRPGTPWSEILDDLVAGRVQTEPMTIPEGFTLRQMAPRIADITGLEEDSVLTFLRADSAHARFEVPGPTLEGYLFPDTYLFAPGVGLETVVQAMTDRYRQAWTPARRARLDSLDLSEREIVTLASIIQAEARVVEEMPMISGVYWNRIERGHRLEADPTVLYALGGPRERLLYAAIDSVADHPYNTYTQPGLPPGPIGAPGDRALAAALRPADTDAFFFVAHPDGSHVFTETLAAHNRAKARSRRMLDSIARERRERERRDPAGDGDGGEW